VLKNAPILCAVSVGLLTQSLVACEGNLAAPVGPAATSEQPVTDPVSSTEGSGDFASGNFDKKQCEGREVGPGPMPQLVRLTHLQYQNAVRDVLGIDANAKDFVPDQVFFGFNNNAEKLVVEDTQTLRYRTAAETIAEEAARDLTNIAKVVPCVSDARDEACRDRFLTDFLELLLRKPLEAAALDRYRKLFALGAEMYDDGPDDFTRGVRITLEAALQSPSFLYRAEIRDTPLDGSVVALDSYEIASRLALTLWASVPDRALLDKAASDALLDEDEVDTEARRMLADPRAERVLDDFHAQWLELDKLRFAKDANTFPAYQEAAFSASARRELLDFTRHVASDEGGVVGDLFTSNVSYVDATLASVYGLTGSFDQNPARVELEPTERAGMLTQLGFLAGHADALDGSPIHRGAYIQKRLLCTVFGALPANVGMLPARSGDIVTTRDQVEAKTAAPACQYCHTKINPAGFAFEHFDTMGRYRTEDHGEAVNAKGKLALDGQTVSFDGAIELGAVLAESGTAMRCYETQWFRYALGRAEANDDLCLLSAIDERAKNESYDIRELLVTFTRSRGFRFRTMEEL